MIIIVFFCFTAIEEDLFHLFFHCPFAVTCWSSLQLQVPNSAEVEDILEAFKLQLHLDPFLYGNCRHHVLGDLDGAEQCYLSGRGTFYFSLQDHIKERICFRSSVSKVKIPPATRSMAASLCVIFLIFCDFLCLVRPFVLFFCLR